MRHFLQVSVDDHLKTLGIVKSDLLKTLDFALESRLFFWKMWKSQKKSTFWKSGKKFRYLVRFFSTLGEIFDFSRKTRLWKFNSKKCRSKVKIKFHFDFEKILTLKKNIISDQNISQVGESRFFVHLVPDRSGAFTGPSTIWCRTVYLEADFRAESFKRL